MGGQRGRHLVHRGEQVTKGLLVGLHQRIGRVGHVEHHYAGKGVNCRLNRVAHIVELVPKAAVPGQPGHWGLLGVGEAVRGGVAVDDVDNPTISQHRIGIGIEVQERCQLLHPFPHVAHVHDLRVLSNEVGDQRLNLPEAQGEGQSAEQ